MRLGVREHVRLQVAGRREALATLLAHELLIGGVYQQVTLVVLFRRELLAARAALIRLFQRVVTVHLVARELCRLIERLFTLITAVWLLPSVTQQMLLQVAVVRKLLPALRALKTFRQAFLAVACHVMREVSFTD